MVNISSVSAPESVPLGLRCWWSTDLASIRLRVLLSVVTPVCLPLSTLSSFKPLIPIMQFYLAGESPSASREIDVDANGSLYDLKDLIAAHFAIVEPQGMFEWYLTESVSIS